MAILCLEWADAMNVSATERARWLKAVTLHDALKSAPAELLRELAPDAWPVKKLLHGPAAATRAARDGVRDRGILDAVRYHSVGYAEWELVGQILYLADYLEPGRSFHTVEHESLTAAVPSDVIGTLRSVAALRVAGTMAAGRPLLAETVEFWNSLVRG
ncbi:MAG: hypothetical protein JSW71_12410 [Gemmatimonadota bacterium]|nr:MAG: hypothetical protein JSW71_12410 [Gemmatimonadota bacterium]